MVSCVTIHLVASCDAAAVLQTGTTEKVAAIDVPQGEDPDFVAVIEAQAYMKSLEVVLPFGDEDQAGETARIDWLLRRLQEPDLGA